MAETMTASMTISTNSQLLVERLNNDMNRDTRADVSRLIKAIHTYCHSIIIQRNNLLQK